MPLNLPDKLPAIELLKEENIFVIDNSRATRQDIRPLRIVILNLMPLKITTETDLVRLLSNTPLQVEISFMKIKSHTSKNTPIEHMKAFYTDFDKMRGEKYDGMIITGAPVEQMDFDALQEYNSPAVPSEMMEKLEAVDVETLTPIEALNFLYELKKTLKGSLNG